MMWCILVLSFFFLTKCFLFLFSSAPSFSFVFFWAKMEKKYPKHRETPIYIWCRSTVYATNVRFTVLHVSLRVTSLQAHASIPLDLYIYEKLARTLKPKKTKLLKDYFSLPYCTVKQIHGEQRDGSGEGCGSKEVHGSVVWDSLISIDVPAQEWWKHKGYIHLERWWDCECAQWDLD